jgi:hypothetical protein
MTLLDLAAQAEDEAIRRAALQRAELLGRMWHKAFPTLQTIAARKAQSLKEREGKRGKDKDEDEDEEEEGEEEEPPEEGWAAARLVGAERAAVRAKLVSLDERDGGGRDGGEMEVDAEVRREGGGAVL